MNIKPNRSHARFVLLAAAALVVASSATAGAAALITGQSVKNESLTGLDIRNGTVKGADVKDGSLTKDDFTGTLAGPQGPRVRRVRPASEPRVRRRRRERDPGTTEFWGAECPAGKKVTGGGMSSDAPALVTVRESAALDNGAGWWVGVHNGNGVAKNSYVWAVCITA